jgi:cell division protein FtsB
MARNRKNQSAAIRLGPALKAFLLCLAIGGSGIGYVWQKGQISELSQQVKKREGRYAELRGQNDKLRTQLATLLSQPALDKRVKELKLGLVQPLPTQIWRLPEPLMEQPGPDRPRQYAAEQSQSESTR